MYLLPVPGNKPEVTWVDDIFSTHFTGGYNGRDPGETAAKQLAYYKKVYGTVQELVESGSALKGVLFWRWAANDPTIVLGTPEQAATISKRRTLFPPCTCGSALTSVLSISCAPIKKVQML